jgi:hypothetical protein
MTCILRLGEHRAARAMARQQLIVDEAIARVTGTARLAEGETEAMDTAAATAIRCTPDKSPPSASLAGRPGFPGWAADITAAVQERRENVKQTDRHLPDSEAPTGPTKGA